MIKYNENNKVKLYFLIYITICSISIATWIIIISFIKFYIINLFSKKDIINLCFIFNR